MASEIRLSKKRCAAMQASRGVPAKTIANNIGVHAQTIKKWLKEPNSQLMIEDFKRTAESKLIQMDAVNIEIAQKAQAEIFKRIASDPDGFSSKILIELIKIPFAARAERIAEEQNAFQKIKENLIDARVESDRTFRKGTSAICNEDKK